MKVKQIKERRLIVSNDQDHNVRAVQDENGKRFIEGYASVFNQRSKLIYEYHQGKFVEFYEVILPGVFDERLNDNTIMTIDHDRTKMLARVSSGTLQLSVDEYGLKYRFQVPNTTLGNDIYEMVARGDYYESSFVFTVDENSERWIKEGDQLVRYISKVSYLYDTSIVIDGAYSNTDIISTKRNLDEFFNEPERAEAEQIEVEKVEPEHDNNEKRLSDIDLFLLENE